MNTTTTAASATLAAITPAAKNAKGTGSNYKVVDFLTFEQLGSSPAMNKKRAAKAGVEEGDVKNFYIGTNGATILKTYIGQHPQMDLKNVVNKIRQAHNPKAADVAIVPAMEKMLTLAINGSEKGTSAVKDKTAAIEAKNAALAALGLGEVLHVSESNNGTRTTITAVEVGGEPAPEAHIANPQGSPEANQAKSEGKAQSSAETKEAIEKASKAPSKK